MSASKDTKKGLILLTFPPVLVWRNYWLLGQLFGCPFLPRKSICYFGNTLDIPHLLFRLEGPSWAGARVLTIGLEMVIIAY